MSSLIIVFCDYYISTYGRLLFMVVFLSAVIRDLVCED
nr:MAG TPA: hypothetical protein [Caudoviricetes sp.]DAN13425.1 MAG TPA: hypothetical protein [Caudoviricetes sp.]DAX18529.1 MAG TPA: hypothetical protein [Caudoviricetes sp.]